MIMGILQRAYSDKVKLKKWMPFQFPGYEMRVIVLISFCTYGNSLLYASVIETNEGYLKP